MTRVRRILCLIVALPLLGAISAPSAGAYTGTPAAAESEFLELLNTTRASAGLGPLVLSPALSGYARAWSAQMASGRGLVHVPNLDAETAAAVPDWSRAAENIGTGSSVMGIHDAFLRSASHRENMLGAYNQVGVGVVVAGTTIWVTFRFASGSLPRDVVAPSGVVINPPLAASVGSAFMVGWWGADFESGIVFFNVDVSDNGGEWVRWLDAIPPIWVAAPASSGQFTFFGTAGHSYAFRVHAVDEAGNASALSPVIQTTVAANAPRPAPYSGTYAVARNGDISAFTSTPIGGPRWNGDVVRGFAMRAAGGGYVLDNYGGIHPAGGAPPLANSAYWLGWDIARGMALNPDGAGGYVLDGWGGLHPLGNAAGVPAGGYWPGWDIARDVILTSTSTPTQPAGYVMDAWGGLHAFGTAPWVTDGPYWPGWTIARDAVANPTGPGGWILDGWGAMHPFGGAPPLATSGYWPGSDIARGAAVWNTPTGLQGYVLDGWGAAHPINNAPLPIATRYWPGQDHARYIATDP